MKKLFIICSLIILLIGGALWLLSHDENDELLFSVHDLDWDDIHQLNEYIFEAFYTDSPHIYNAQMAGLGYLYPVLEFLKENLNYVRDIPVDNELSFKVHLSDITGNENFWGNVDYSKTRNDGVLFELVFYFDRALDLEFFDALRQAGRLRAIAENPDSFNEIRITLAEVDWENVFGENKLYVQSLSLEIPSSNDRGFEIAIFNNESDKFYEALRFIYVNQNYISYQENSVNRFIGVINFVRQNDNSPPLLTRFYVDEAFGERFIEKIGLENL